MESESRLGYVKARFEVDEKWADDLGQMQMHHEWWCQSEEPSAALCERAKEVTNM